MEVATIPNLSWEITEIAMPWMALLFSVVVAIMFKDFASSLSKGIAFRINGTFKEGDRVLLDDKEATIIKIGFRQTVFGVYCDQGFVWRYVPNERISYIKLEKIIDSGIHKDTEKEKGMRIRKYIDATEEDL